MPLLSELPFENQFVAYFAADPETETYPRQVKDAFFSFTSPTPTKETRLLAWSEDMARKFNLSQPELESEDTDILGGQKVLTSMKPYAACYGGHQFGHWAGQLGDGRAITLGEMHDSDGRSWELQLKGAGLTPYSRTADGRAVLRSSIREFITSEAMFHLNVPTTRALSLVSTGDQVMRDMFYDGHPAFEPGAITARMAPSFLRFGNFEILAARGEKENLIQLMDWTIDNFYPEINSKDYADWFDKISQRTAHMIAQWLRVGFVHGVMNTDNMSILGLTIDYGPYGFLDNYDPRWTPNTTDLPGRRYCFGQQPPIALWNLERLADALSFAVDDQDIFVDGLKNFQNYFQKEFLQMMSLKLGIRSLTKEDISLLEELDRWLQKSDADMTIFYRKLCVASPSENINRFNEALYSPTKEALTELAGWLKSYEEVLQRDPQKAEERVLSMKTSNPVVIPRNYIVHEIIESATKGDLSPLHQFQKVIASPYDESVDQKWQQKRPDWAKTQPGCSTLSCSS